MPAERGGNPPGRMPRGVAGSGGGAEPYTGAVLDSLTASIAVIDESGLILAVNRAWREFARANDAVDAGVAPGVNYLRVCDAASGDDAEGARAFAEGIREVLDGRRAEFSREYPCHAPGRRRWFVGRVTRLAGDGPVRAVVAHEDVSDRKRMEEAIGQSEARLQKVLDHAQASIFLKDLHGRYLLINRRFTELFGLTREDAVGKTDQEIFPRDVAEVFRESDRRAMAAGAPVEAEEDIPCAGGVRTAIVIKVPLLGPDGAPDAVCGIATDITERKRAEEALRESESVLRSFYDGVPVALAVAEVVGTGIRIISANASLARLLGRPPGGLERMPSDELEVPASQRRRWLDAYREAVEHGRPARSEQAWETPDGPRWFAVMVNAITYEPRGLPRFYVAIEDITERKRAEREIFDLNAELELRLERISGLRAIDTAITASLDLPLTLGVVIEQVLTRLDVDAAAILRWSPRMPTLEYAVLSGYRGGAKPGAWQRIDEGPAGRAIRECRTQYLPDASDPPTALPELSRAEAFVAYWAVPLVVKGQVKGVLEVGHRDRLDPEPDWLEYLQALAGQAAIAIDGAELFDGLRRSNLELSLAYDATIEGWSRAMELRDHETEGHSRRVTEMTLRLARAIGVDEAELVHIRRGAMLHDIGKIGIPDAILLKAGALTDEETRIMRRHPEYAMRMLAPIAFLRQALDIPYCHHEKWDGTGYPRGLEGEQIPMAARIFAVADIWDALCFDRPYRKGWPRKEVREYIRSIAGTYLDARVVEAFLGILRDEMPDP